MSVALDIAATYRGPRRVVRRLLEMGTREDRALALLMAGCAVVFIAQWPRLAREAHLAGEALNPRLAGALLGWIVIAPLMFYLLAFLSQLVARVIGGRVTGFGARLALFWAFLATSPLLLLHGLVAGFIGPGVGLTIVGAIWCGVFLWFWISGLCETGWSRR
ncbi:YIP1 family protein [Roseovarius autotrophicus]|uniref:YIP1 family protein n=1 Tax=Roseovarius autotrophicus TaxID=2824121 RepID=UPI0019F3AA8D|nr:YIP1 family protein [Roseovarius autotrophicus]MBE0453899.1 YIP1 family protein [Roseovarius sp.]